MESTDVMGHTDMEEKEPQLRLGLGPEEIDCCSIFSSNHTRRTWGLVVLLFWVSSKEKKLSTFSKKLPNEQT